MFWLTGIFALFVAGAGWHYLFYSRAARRLETVEQQAANALRTRLRRIGGLCMLLLGGALFALLNVLDLERPSAAAAALLLAILILLGTITALALVDLRLTWRLRRRP
ncbi:MAG: hypothetical protein ACHRHE_12905 [Tepidisphaerales bacterium]